MGETEKPTDVAGKGKQNLVAGLAIVVIAGSGWFVWQRIANDPHLLSGDSDFRNRTASGRAFSQYASQTPGYDTSKATIPIERIMNGGPGKDGIPALTDAKFVSAEAAPFMLPEDRVIGIVMADQAKAYPLKILDYHEAVNDRLAGKSITVTYCPLCDSSVVFDRMIGDREYEFGISGLLFNSNVLLFDRGKEGEESLWSQMASSAVVGAKNGQSLKRLPLEVTAWSDWQERHPETLVLSNETGQPRSYEGRAYQSYFASPDLMFPVEPLDDRLAEKTQVLGVATSNSQRAYSLASFADGQAVRIEDQIDGLRLTLVYDPQHKSLRVEQAEEGLQWIYSFWFAWAAFYPETDIYESPAAALESKTESQEPAATDTKSST